MDLGFNLAQSNRDLKDPTSRQNFGDTSGLLCKNDLIPCLMTSDILCLKDANKIRFFSVFLIQCFLVHRTSSICWMSLLAKTAGRAGRVSSPRPRNEAVCTIYCAIL